MMLRALVLALVPLLGPGCDRSVAAQPPPPPTDKSDKVVKTEDEWRKILTPDQFHVLREHGTERAFSGAYWDKHDKAVYVCAACGKRLFSSEQKFDSGTGWPSFWAPIAPGAVATEKDDSYGMERTEVHCPRCGGHLGHVFDDGPKPTGLRYCINSVSLRAVAP
jgi:peptide-methionine (R)-S-oxide reductase